MSKSEVNTGDGLGSSTATPSTVAAMSARVTNLMNKHGTPNKVPRQRFDTQMALINSKFKARSNAQKEAVKDALTYLAIVHGCGPNVKWEDIACQPEECEAVQMSEIVDGIVTRAFHRRFMVNFSARANEMYDASPELQNVLMSRAVRNGIPITEAKSVIDFLDSSSGVSPSTIAYRVRSKYSAVQRANTNPQSSVERSAKGASADMHGMGGDAHDDADSLGGY